MAKKSWREKFEVAAEPSIETMTKSMWGFPAGTRLLVPTPKLVAEEISAIPKGEVHDIAELRKKLATKHGAEATCPLTSGIFLRIIAEMTFEELQNGKKPSQVIPFWRALPKKAPARKKLTFDPDIIDSLLAKEA